MDILNLVRTYWDRVGAIGCTIAGAVMLVLGWSGVSKEAFPAAQIPYVVSDGFGGLFLLGVGAVLWLSADLRDEWSKLDELDARLETLATLAGAGSASLSETAPVAPAPARRARRAEAPAAPVAAPEDWA